MYSSSRLPVRPIGDVGAFQTKTVFQTVLSQDTQQQITTTRSDTQTFLYLFLFYVLLPYLFFRDLPPRPLRDPHV